MALPAQNYVRKLYDQTTYLPNFLKLSGNFGKIILRKNGKNNELIPSKISLAHATLIVSDVYHLGTNEISGTTKN